MKQQIPAIILDKEKNNFIVLILSDGAQSRFNFNLDCIQKTRITLYSNAVKWIFRIKKGRKFRFSTLFSLFIVFLRLEYYIGYYISFNIDVNHSIEKCPFFRY
jgi:hypothetical protein